MTDGAPIIDISVGSRFHAFDLARELSRHGMLRHLHTGYPAFSGPRFGVSRQSIRSVWTGEPLNRALSILYRRGWVGERKDAFISERHDRIVAARLRSGADVFIGWSSQCRLSLAAARRLSMKTVVERGSTHIEWQRDQLQEEMRLTGLPVDLPSSRTVEQELAEYDSADFISVPSAFAATTFVNKGVPASKLLVNPYGVDLHMFDVSDAVRPHRQEAGIQVLHVGRVSARKGVHYLADAVSRVQGARLTLVGSEEEGIRKFLGQPSTAVIGAVAGSELPSWYRAADVFCLLSIEEGLALVIVQAMAMGLPVIATPNTGAEELIEHGVHGFIVPPRDPAAAAERIQQLAGDESLRRRMGQQARARVAERFDWTHYGNRARAHYLRIMNQPGMTN
jgi:glycosyltransferase involved in cell wall biosynthesis